MFEALVDVTDALLNVADFCDTALRSSDDEAV